MKSACLQNHWRLAGLGLAAFVISALPAACGQKADWDLKIQVTESCSCAPACPCIFGSAPTAGHCHLNWCVRIDKGRYGALRLDGVTLVMTDEMRKWRKYYFDTNATPEQVQAITNMFAQIRALAVEKVLSVEQVPLRFEQQGGRIKFSVPASAVEIETKKGPNGKAITIQNTGLADYVQYVSLTNYRRSDDVNWAYAGTSGATWKFEASSSKKGR